MGWLSRLWRRRYRAVADLARLGQGRVEVEGRVEPLEVLRDPLDGRACVAIEYRAWPPATTVGMDGATAHNSRAFQIEARQAVDFVLSNGRSRVLVHVDAGEDLSSLHRDLLERYGVQLRSEVEIIDVGSEVRVEGVVKTVRSASTSPHRSEPWAGEIQAERLWLVVRN